MRTMSRSPAFIIIETGAAAKIEISDVNGKVLRGDLRFVCPPYKMTIESSCLYPAVKSPPCATILGVNDQVLYRPRNGL